MQIKVTLEDGSQIICAVNSFIRDESKSFEWVGREKNVEEVLKDIIKDGAFTADGKTYPASRIKYLEKYVKEY